MRVRAKEIRKSRKREEERIKAEIKTKKAAKAPSAPARPRARKAAAAPEKAS